MAEEEGFEPPCTVRHNRFSKPTQSAALPLLRIFSARIVAPAVGSARACEAGLGAPLPGPGFSGGQSFGPPSCTKLPRFVASDPKPDPKFSCAAFPSVPVASATAALECSAPANDGSALIAFDSASRFV